MPIRKTYKTKDDKLGTGRRDDRTKKIIDIMGKTTVNIMNIMVSPDMSFPNFWIAICCSWKKFCPSE
jgi:hypothetical protein